MENAKQAARRLAALKRAIDLAGGPTAVAERLNVHQTAVSHWIYRSEQAPVDRVLALEELTGVSRHELRDDIYGPPTQQAEGAGAA